MAAVAPLELHAPYRWAVLGTWRRLHRIARLGVSAQQFEELAAARGQTVCKRFGVLETPGVASRLGLARCAHCCNKLGIPRGNGAPFNVFTDERRNQ